MRAPAAAVLILVILPILLIAHSLNHPERAHAQDDRGCFGQIVNLLTRGVIQVRNPINGSLFLHPTADFNPGDFGGSKARASMFAALGFEQFIALNGCGGPVPFVGRCVDFNAGSQCAPRDSDLDGYSDDIEGDSGSDPQDFNNTPESALLDEQFGTHTCSDAVDNDLDGNTDHGDAGCRLICTDFASKLQCSDADGDGWLRYVELRYGSDPDNAGSTPETSCLPPTMHDGVDNDSDGEVDQGDLDSACQVQPF